MVLNDNGIPCMRIIEYEVIGTKPVQIGTQRRKRGRGYQVVPEYMQVPNKKQKLRLIPATERGWKEEITFERPFKNSNTGRVEIHQYKLNKNNFRCSRCKTSKHILLYLVGWSYDKYPTLPHKGSGPVWRCFKCDLTVGPIDPSKYGEEIILKKDATEREAIKILKKYGLDAPEFGPIG